MTLVYIYIALGIAAAVGSVWVWTQIWKQSKGA